MPQPLTHHDIYEAALHEALFDTLPERLATALDMPSGICIWMHPGDFREIAASTQPEANLSYADFMDHDLWVHEIRDDRVGIGPMRLSQFVPEETYRNSLIYNEYAKFQCIDRFWCMGMIHDTRDGRVVTSVHKERHHGDFTDEEFRAMGRMADDLGRMHAIRRELTRNSIHELTKLGQDLHGSLPMFELSHEGRLLRMNGRAERLLQLHPLMVLTHHRQLGLGGPARRPFHQAVGQATLQDHARAGQVDLPPLRGIDGRALPGLRLTLLPRTEGGRRALVMVSSDDPEALALAMDMPRDRPQLSEREREVLFGLARGQQRDRLAFDLGISVPTVDMHSAALRRKLGARTVLQAVMIATDFGLI